MLDETTARALGYGGTQQEIGGERGIRTLGRVSPTHAFQACAFNHSAISPSLESTTYGLLRLAQKAFCVRPPNVPRSLTGARAEAKAPKRPAPDPSTMLFATTRERSTQFLLRRRATKTHDRVVATVPALLSRRTHRDCWSTGDPGNRSAASGDSGRV